MYRNRFDFSYKIKGQNCHIPTFLFFTVNCGGYEWNLDRLKLRCYGSLDLNALDRWTVVVVFICILKWEMNSQIGDVLAVCTL